MVDFKSKLAGARPVAATATATTATATATAVLAPALSDADTAPIRESASTIDALACQHAAITTREQYDAAGSIITTIIRPMLSRADELFDENIKSWHEGHKKAIALKKRETAPFHDAEALLRTARERWRRADEERQRQVQQALVEEQERAARKAARAELARQLEEGSEHEARELAADLAQGNITPATPPPPLVLRTPKTEGASLRKLKRYRIVDVTKIDRAFMVPDERAIQAKVDALGKGAEMVVGAGSIEYFEIESEGFRR